MPTAYCERGSELIHAEPLNALSNLAFLLAAALIAGRLWREAPRRADVWLLALLAATVGIGSFLWHTLATPWSQWADVIPVGLFTSVFLLSFGRRVARWAWPSVAAAFSVYLAVNGLALATLPADFLNGSVFYLPTWAALLAMAIQCRCARAGAARRAILMFGIFSVALLLRSVDAVLCPLFPIGTHFAWHLLAAVVLYLGMRLLIDRLD